MSYYKGYEIVQTYVRNHKSISLNEFLSDNKQALPVLSSSITINNGRELADIWRKRINEEVGRSNCCIGLLKLPKVVHNDWQLAYELALEYKLTAHEFECSALRTLRSANARVASNVDTLFESNNNKRKLHDLEEMSTSLLSKIVFITVRA